MIKLNKYICNHCKQEHKKAELEYLDIKIYNKPAFQYTCYNCNNIDVFTLKKKYKDSLECDTILQKQDIINYYEIELIQIQYNQCSNENYKHNIEKKYKQYKDIIVNL